MFEELSDLYFKSARYKPTFGHYWKLMKSYNDYEWFKNVLTAWDMAPCNNQYQDYQHISPFPYLQPHVLIICDAHAGSPVTHLGFSWLKSEDWPSWISKSQTMETSSPFGQYRELRVAGLLEFKEFGVWLTEEVKHLR
ncbi:hypothetical protein Sango_1241500 [Sesamum angolense]|uniref:Uncharacterized protein n=1 Tax=Sesamum angolense TaxID=2727404 RepID=A0AAE1WQJ5_9LAMI|nr:hypothetical protein Sango_1241500 [Sesamum angolense]